MAAWALTTAAAAMESTPPPPVTFATKLVGLLRLRCPVCWQGPMFLHPLAMHERCPECNYLFDKGNGYFLGAMYASFPLSLAMTLAAGAVLWVLGLPLWFVGLGVVATACTVGPLVAFPYSRVLWVWMERDGHLHDGEEDPARLKRLARERYGLRTRRELRAVRGGQARAPKPPRPAIR